MELENKTLNDLCPLIIEWAKDKGIAGKENASRQFLKLVEETGELAAGLAKQNEAQTKDALGDVFVVWAILCEQLGYKPEEVVQEAYGIISKRKGKTVNGVFIKEEDLQEDK